MFNYFSHSLEAYEFLKCTVYFGSVRYKSHKSHTNTN
jgi:hypothetical protein